MKILNHLKSDEVLEGNTATLRVALTKPRSAAFWFRNGEAITTGGKYKVEVFNEGLLHSLTIDTVTEEDSGDFTVNAVDDLGCLVTSKCKIAVKV